MIHALLYNTLVIISSYLNLEQPTSCHFITISHSNQSLELSIILRICLFELFDKKYWGAKQQYYAG